MPALEPSSSSSGTKRGAAHRDGSVSPPPLKRKAQSALTKSAVTAFFTPASQKKRDPVVWTERSPDDDTPPTLLVAKYVPERGEDQPLSQRRKIAAFDLDSTLITSASGKKHADSATDWKWWDRSVPGRLKQLYDEEG
ncbi:hypothetical protein VTK73DRAFT_5867 [Phialemonium thermophilum]|uniref:Uncharacterized protein n=1 Tax=Phialemonium thermophilum TaxID=223376 RepID=A0ABR3V0B6_9PEZI